MSKSEKAFRTITEASEILSLPAHVLRFWESRFKYIKPLKRGGGRRYYRPEDLQLLRGIKYLLYSQGLTIKGTQNLIQKKGLKAIMQMGTKADDPVVSLSEVKREKVISLTLSEGISPALKHLLRRVSRSDLTPLVEKLEVIKNKMENRN